MRLCVGHQHSHFWLILVRFVHYYSMIDDSRGAFTCPSSTLTVLFDSGPFCGLLLIVLGPKAIPMVVIVVLADSGPFLGPLLSFGSRSDLHD